MSNILVTGGAGFIGSNLSFKLTEMGHKVFVLDNFSTGKTENLNGFKGEIIDDDMMSYSILENFLENYDIEYIFHEAAIPSVKKSIDDPHRNVGNNVNSTLNLMEAVRLHGRIKKVIAASSSSVYGDAIKLPKIEIDAIDPVSPYALSKYFTEKIVLHYGQFYDIPVIALRYFNVFGPKQDAKSPYSAVIVKFIEKIAGNEPIEIYGDGEQTRDFTYVNDVVNANINAMRSNVKCDFFNIATGSRISLNDLKDKLFKLMGKEVEVKYLAPRPGDIKHSLSSIDKAKKILNYEPKFDMKKGLKATIDYFTK